MFDLKPCLKCGSKQIHMCSSLEDQSIFFRCDNCGYDGPRVFGINNAARAWNINAIFSMDKIIKEVESGIAKGKAQKVESTNPSHYSRWKIEPLDFISANNLDFLRGNIIKYIMRYDAKGGLEDLKKARVYLDKLIDNAEKD